MFLHTFNIFRVHQHCIDVVKGFPVLFGDTGIKVSLSSMIITSSTELELFKFLRTSTLYRKFETTIPRNETAWPRSQSVHSCICERFIYSHDQSAYFAILRLRLFLGMFVSNFLYRVHLPCGHRFHGINSLWPVASLCSYGASNTPAASSNCHFISEFFDCIGQLLNLQYGHR